MDSVPGTIEFVASLPSIKSAILLDGMGDGGQVKLEVDRSNVGALVLLQQWYAGMTFKVRVEPDEPGCNPEKSRKIHI